MRRILVDGMNVIGSRPDGWWRDRRAAARRLLERLRVYVEATDEVEVMLIFDGASPRVEAERVDDVPALYARDHGFRTADDLIVALLQDNPDVAATTEVITSDRALRDRVRVTGATVSGPGALLQKLDTLDQT